MHKIPPFKNQKLFEQAFIHRSYLNESRQKMESNERLEFLGDSVLSFVVSDYLYTKYPEFNEGILTNLRSLLVNTKSLANLARELELGTYLKLSRGEEESEGRKNQSLLADCLEALLGALFLDQGIEVVRAFLMENLIPQAEELVQNRTFKDPKSLLQEQVQSLKFPSPSYRVIKEEGPAHAKLFTMGVFVEDKLIGQGSGKSKQEAEEMAAKEVLHTYSTPSSLEKLLRN